MTHSNVVQHRRDECDRVKMFGARVLTLDQVYGVKDPSIECWGTEEEDGGDPPRLWAPNGNYPGTAFTRSIGDNGKLLWDRMLCDFAHSEDQGTMLGWLTKNCSQVYTPDCERTRHLCTKLVVVDLTCLCCDAAAETIGVCAEPELAIRNLTPANPFFLIGSDGIFEFMPSQTVVDMVSTMA